MFILFFTSLFFQNYAAFFINIDAHGEECFHDKVDPGTRMALMFEVADGGFLDIDVQVLTVFENVSYIFYLRYSNWSWQKNLDRWLFEKRVLYVLVLHLASHVISQAS